jgi:threonine dehydratase
MEREANGIGPGEFREGVEAAAARIRPEAERTPLLRAEELGRLAGADVFLKAEYAQPTGSFKVRGALNKVHLLGPEALGRGIVSASTGNHGLAVSFAARLAGTSLVLFIPESISAEKKRRLQASDGVRLELVAGSCEQAEARARRFAAGSNRVFISPYNDLDIVLGQGTAGLEILADLPEVEDVIVPVGGGGLIAGVAGFVKAAKPGARVIGVEPLNTRFMWESVRAGRLVEVEEKETLAEAVAGGIEPGSLTFPLVRRFVDALLLVEEDLIARSVALIHRTLGAVVEGAGALAAAGLLARPDLFRGRTVALVASGGNILLDLHRRILAESGRDS